MNEATSVHKKRILYPLILLAVVTLLAIGAVFAIIMLGGGGGVAAQDFTLPYIGQEGSFTLSEQRGNVVLINLFGSWCEPCRDEAPILQAAWEDYQGRNVVFVGIAIEDTEADALAYIEEFGITYLNVIDLDSDVQRIYNIYGVPVTLIVDTNGNVVKTFFARPPESELREAIDGAL
jgi:thiol-disulfide isomerase/thioredoxin